MFEDVTKKLKQFEKYQRMAALSVFAVHKPRIFEKGLDADGQKIGEYVDGPYKDKRRKKGRETSFVNLEMTGAMKKDYQPSKEGTVVGFGFSNKTEFEKSVFNEERYQTDIFQLTKAESDLYMKTLDELVFGGK